MLNLGIHIVQVDAIEEGYSSTLIAFNTKSQVCIAFQDELKPLQQ